MRSIEEAEVREKHIDQKNAFLCLLRTAIRTQSDVVIVHGCHSLQLFPSILCKMLSLSEKILPSALTSAVFMVLRTEAILARPGPSLAALVKAPIPKSMPMMLMMAEPGSLTESYVASAALPSSPAIAMARARVPSPAAAAASSPTNGTTYPRDD
jgi:hypothetical protein